MRAISGHVVLPSNAPAGEAARVVVEVRDVSVADAPSTVIAEQRLERVRLKPHARIPFTVQVPDVSPSRTLSMRVHVDVAGNGHVSPGDLLTTTSRTLPAAGDPGSVDVAVTLV